MDPTSEQILRVVLQGGLLERARAVAHLDEHVQIAACSPFTASGPEHAHLGRTVARGDARDLVAALAQRVEGGHRSGRTRVGVRLAHELRVMASVGLS